MAERTAAVIEALALALWIGALAGFAFVFAPIAFHLVASLDTFARLIAAVIRALGTLGFVCGSLAILAAFVRARDESLRPLAVMRIVFVLIMLGLAYFESQALVPKMETTAKSFGGPLASISKSDPRRLRYDALHRRSSEVYGLVLVLGLVTIALTTLGRPERRPRLSPLHTRRR